MSAINRLIKALIYALSTETTCHSHYPPQSEEGLYHAL